MYFGCIVPSLCLYPAFAASSSLWPSTLAPVPPPATSTVASKATKTTQARKTIKAKCRPRPLPKSNKANTTNPVQKRTSTNRIARRYIHTDKDSHTVDNGTSRTASPDYISDTPIPPRRVIPETPPSSGQAQLEAENARLRKELRHHRH